MFDAGHREDQRGGGRDGAVRHAVIHRDRRGLAAGQALISRIRGIEGKGVGRGIEGNARGQSGRIERQHGGRRRGGAFGNTGSVDKALGLGGRRRRGDNRQNGAVVDVGGVAYAANCHRGVALQRGPNDRFGHNGRVIGADDMENRLGRD